MLRDVAQSFCQDATSRSGVHPWRSPMLSPRGTPPRGSASARRACGAPRRRTVFAGEGGLEATAAITSPLDSPRSGFSSIDSLDSPISLEWSLQCSTPKDVDEPPDPLAPPGDMSGGGLLRASHKASLLLTSPPKSDGESRGDTIIDQLARCMPRRGPPAIPSAGSTLSTVNGCTTPSPLRSNSQLCLPRRGRRALGDDDGDSPWRAAWTVRVHDEPPQQPLFLQVPALQRSEGEDASDFMARVHFREPSSGRHDEELMSSAADDSAADDSSSGDGRTSPEGAAAPACADLSGLLRRRRRPTAADGNEEAQRVQFPLCLAFARTYHSAQGSTINTPVDMDLISVSFKKHGVWKQVPGLVYVALSRVRSLAQIRFRVNEKLKNVLHPSSCLADARVVAFHKTHKPNIPTWVKTAVAALVR